MNLIQLYEKKSVLWNPSNPEYFHRDIRNMVYDDLVRELNIDNLTVNETKRKLENLRSYFRRETKKLQDHERKTNEKLVSRWPYYESLQFIHEFMSVKNESGAELGFAKNMSSRTTYQLPTMKREPEDCAVQVPIGSTTTSSLDSAFHQLANNDLVAVLKALQGPLAETAASCFGIPPDMSEHLLQNGSANNGHSPNYSPKHSCSPIRKETCDMRADTPVQPLLPHNLALPNMNPLLKVETDTSKKRKLFERQGRGCQEEDLCGNYGRTVAHQLRQMESYDRDLCRLQIDQLIFNIKHKDKKIGQDVDQTPPSTQG